MIPSHKITLSEELCQIVEGKKGKKLYECQICSKKFNRKDTINYHVYIEHREEFLEFGKGLPDVLTREDSDDDQPPTKSKSNNAAAAVFKRIFAPKLKSGNNAERKGQVEIEIKSKSDKKDEVDEDEMRVSQQPRKDHQKIQSTMRKDYSEKVDKKSDQGCKITKPAAEHTKPSAVKIDDKKIHGKAKVKEEKKSKQQPPEDIFDSLLDPNDAVQEIKTKDRKLEKSLNEDLIIAGHPTEKTAVEPPAATSPPITKAKKRTSRSSRNVPEEQSSTRSSSRNVPEEQLSTRSSSRNVPEEHQPSSTKLHEDLVSPKDVSEKTAIEPLATSLPTKAKKRSSRSNVPDESSSKNVPEEQQSSTKLNEDLAGPKDVSEKTAVVEQLTTSPSTSKAKKRTSRSSRNVPEEHQTSTKKTDDLGGLLEPESSKTTTTNKTTSNTEESMTKKNDFPSTKEKPEEMPEDDSIAIQPLGRRGRKPKVPKKIPQDEPPADDLDREQPNVNVVPDTPPPAAVMIGKRTRGSSRKSESEPCSASAMEEIPLATSPKLDKEEKPLVSPTKIKSDEKSNVVIENYKKIQPSRNKSSSSSTPEKPPRVVPEKASSPKSKTSSNFMEFGNPIVLIEKTPPHEVTKLTSPRRELLQDEQQPIVSVRISKKVEF